MTLDFSNPGFWLSLAQSVAIVLLWLRRPGEDASRELAGFRAAQVESASAMRGRLDVVEERLRHMPTSEEVRELEGKLSAIKAELGGLKESVSATRNGVSRIEQFLLTERHKP